MNQSNNQLSVHHHGWGTVELYRVSNWLWRHNWRLPALVAKYLNILLFRCYIDPQANIGPRLSLQHGGFGVVIGPKTVIGSDALIFHNVTLGSRRPGPTVIGDRVYIGTGATILGPVTVGSGVKIGANTVVIHDLPDEVTVVSSAARVTLGKQSKESTNE